MKIPPAFQIARYSLIVQTIATCLIVNTWNMFHNESVGT
jgi:hypothetical protein